MSRQNFYQGTQQRKREAVDEALVLVLVNQVRALHPRMGTRKLRHVLEGEFAKAGLQIGRDRLFDLLRRAELLVEPRPGAPRTTQWDPSLPTFPNLLEAMKLSRPHEAWVSDLTYVRTREGFGYLWLITDAYSRKIVGWHLAARADTAGALRALARAWATLPAGATPVHHSDRGSQYASHDYVAYLQARGLPISMTQVWHCYENAKAERVNGILKGEYGLEGNFANLAAAERAITQAIWLYNHCRPHLALNYRVPAAVHEDVA
jgi:putative transposase